MEIEVLKNLFLEKTKYDENKHILAILFYGSRVKKNNRDSSDLDVLLITDGIQDFKVGMNLDGVQVDCQSYSIQNIYAVMQEKKIKNNQYFESVFQHCMIVKDENDTVAFVLHFLNEINHSNSKRKKSSLSRSMLNNLKKYYLSFKRAEDDYSYYNLLEFIRKSYHVLFGFSYVSVLKVWEVYMNKEKYEREDLLYLPPSSFTNLYREALVEKDSVKRWNYLKELLSILQFDFSFLFSEEVEESFLFLSEEEIRYRLLVLANKIEKVVLFIKENVIYGEASYFFLLRELREFYAVVYGEETEEFYSLFLEGLHCFDSSHRVDILFQLFSIIEKDYRFDYKNYVLKL